MHETFGIGTPFLSSLETTRVRSAAEPANAGNSPGVSPKKFPADPRNPEMSASSAGEPELVQRDTLVGYPRKFNRKTVPKR